MGSRILYYLIVKPISLLPYFLLYLLSDVIYFFMYYVVRYRKKVVIDNIYQSFTDNTEKENRKIVKGFYRYLCDLIVESIKIFSASPKQVQKRYFYENVEVLDKFYEQGKSVITFCGHYGSWEMFALTLGSVSKLKQYFIYKPLSNQFFEEKLKKSRGRNGLKVIPMKSTREYFENDVTTPKSIAFGSDQWPAKPEYAIWTKFLGRETPFLYGAEKYAKEFDWPIVYCDVIRIKRGHYKGVYSEVTAQPNQFEKGEIMIKYAGLLEKTILRDPALWLWSHKRWKKNKEEVFGVQNTK